MLREYTGMDTQHKPIVDYITRGTQDPRAGEIQESPENCYTVALDDFQRYAAALAKLRVFARGQGRGVLYFLAPSFFF